MRPTFYVGLDVSKGYADIAVLDGSRQRVCEPMQLFDLHEGHTRFINLLDELNSHHNPQHIFVAAESTGGLENHWLRVTYHHKDRLPVKVARLNPLGVARHRQAEMKTQITDRSSSEAIARYLINHEHDVVCIGNDSFAKYREHLSHIELWKKQKVQITNKLHQHLYEHFPEILCYCQGGFTQYILLLLQKYPDTRSVANARSNKPNIPYLPQKTWDELRERCRKEKYRVSDPMTAGFTRRMARQLLEYQRNIKDMVKDLYAVLPQEKLEILRSMPGVDKDQAVTFLCLMGDVGRFLDASQVVGYFGLYPVIKESGDGKKKPHICKRGNRLMRKKLYIAAMSAVQYDPYLGSMYAALVERGKPKVSALCIIMKKMLRMMYGMLKNMQNYNPLIDAANQEKYKQIKEENEVAMYEPMDPIELALIDLAPISRRNAKQRKEQTGAKQAQGSNGLPAAPVRITLKT